MARNLVKIILAMVVAGITSAASAQPVRCGQRSEVVTFLENVFGERQHGYGIAGRSALIELFLSPTGTWTILMTGQDRRTCIVAAGHGWEDIPAVEGHEVGRRAAD